MEKSHEFKNGWPLVAASMLGIGLGLSPVPFYTIGMLAPELAKAFGWSFTQIQFGLLIMTAVVILSSPIAGFLADRHGVRPVVLCSVVLFSLGFMAFGLSTGSLVQFYATWVLCAMLGAGTLPVTWTRAINNRFDLHRGMALGLSLVGTGLFGFAVKPFTAWLIAHHGWRSVYFAVGALPLMLSFPLAFLVFHDVGGTGAAERRAALAARKAATPGLTYGQALREWRFWVIGVAFLSISFAVGGAIPNMENILKTQGFERAAIVSLVSLIGLSVIAGRVVGGWLIDRFWAPAVAAVILLGPALSSRMLAQPDLSSHWAAAAIVLIGFAAGMEYDLMAYLAARYFGLRHYSTIYGTLYGFFGVGAGFAPAFYANAFDHARSYQMPLTVGCGLLLLGALLLLTLGRYREFAAVATTSTNVPSGADSTPLGSPP